MPVTDGVVEAVVAISGVTLADEILRVHVMEAGEPVVNVKSAGVPAEQIVCVAVALVMAGAAVVNTVTVVEKVSPEHNPVPYLYFGVTVITTSLFSSLLFINVPVVKLVAAEAETVTDPLETPLLTVTLEGNVAVQWYSITSCPVAPLFTLIVAALPEHIVLLPVTGVAVPLLI
jgi:hypothetical protein